MPELKAGQLVIMDNTIFHKYQTTHELIKKAGCKILFLLPYSLNLNSIETYWANLRRLL
ncbi:transposase [Neochlamydia sp. S13]|uniref:transposase n=1 Tax=Neochlamydia sp. S13 TaxID=1353976 RepID=UPI000FD1715C|nr:Putative uncharacterized protein [Neochlamydia sp. S13]